MLKGIVDLYNSYIVLTPLHNRGGVTSFHGGPWRRDLAVCCKLRGGVRCLFLMRAVGENKSGKGGGYPIS